LDSPAVAFRGDRYFFVSIFCFLERRCWDCRQGAGAGSPVPFLGRGRPGACSPPAGRSTCKMERRRRAAQ